MKKIKLSVKISGLFFAVLFAFTACEAPYDVYVFNQENYLEFSTVVAAPKRAEPQNLEDMEEVKEKDIQLVGELTPFEKGKEAVITISAKPLTEYNLRVLYSSGESSASGLGTKISDENGIVSWSWRVGIKTKEGSYRAVISGNGETFEVDIQIK